METFEKRTIDDLITRYSLEPSLTDIYVEGSSDKDILDYYFAHNSIDKIAYEINSVEIPPEILKKYSLTNGNKQRVQALAKEFSIIDDNLAVRFLVDKDFDHWVEKIEEIPRLVWTDYCSMELYFLTEEILENILIRISKSKLVDFKVFFDGMIDTLTKIYQIRLANEELNLKMQWIPIERYLFLDKGKISINISKYIEALLNKNQKFKSKSKLTASIKKWELKTTGDCRYCIRGHDLIDYLGFTVKKMKGLPEFSTPQAIERLLVASTPKLKNLELLFN